MKLFISGARNFPLYFTLYPQIFGLGILIMISRGEFSYNTKNVITVVLRYGLLFVSGL